MGNEADTKVVGKALKVEINGQYLPVKSYKGGEPVRERSSRRTKSKQSSGPISVSELTIQAYVTPNQKILSDAADQVVNKGQNKLFTITIFELAKDKSVVKTFVYNNCLLTSLDYPTLSAQGGEILCQTATFKPETLQVR
ncbi:MAG: hypothetical protein GY847_19845 [Proteobacteria bacterium]|nr:hypothetical protein [Pseudomonadota bacterium]